MTNPRQIPKTNWPWPPPGHTTSCAVRTGRDVGVGLALPGVRMINANAEMVATVSGFLTVGSSHTWISNSERLLFAGSLRFFTGEPAVRKALTAATNYPVFRMVNAEPGAGSRPPAPCATRSRRRGRLRACPPKGHPQGVPLHATWHGHPARDVHGQDPDGSGQVGHATPLRLRRPVLPGSAAMYTEGTVRRLTDPLTAKGLADLGVQENEICAGKVASRLWFLII
jgi:hypothetical protein